MFRLGFGDPAGLEEEIQICQEKSLGGTSEGLATRGVSNKKYPFCYSLQAKFKAPSDYLALYGTLCLAEHQEAGVVDSVQLGLQWLTRLGNSHSGPRRCKIRI